MSTSTLGLFLRHLALSEEVSRLGTTSDHNLLAAYEAEHGQAAFTELVRRHGPMVLRTCRRVLSHEPDAEDAFQATFVLLARKAGQLRREVTGPLSLGGWLHHVAYQTALKVLRGAVRRRDHERQVHVMTHSDRDPSAKATWNEIQPILDAELDALPKEARRLLIAYYLQEKTYTEVAVELGLPRGSVARRLEKARALLAERLARRGITVSASLLAVLLGESAKGSGIPAVLLVHTVEAARRFADQVTGIMSDHVARLVKGGLAKMTKGWTYLNMVLVGLLGAGLLACQTLKAWPERTSDREPPATPAAERPAQERDRQVHTDRYGDLLPTGALARMGTTRLRHTEQVNHVFFMPDSKTVASEGMDDTLRFWDVATGKLVRCLKQPGKVIWPHPVSFARGAKTLVSVNGKQIWLWDVRTGDQLCELKLKLEQNEYVLAVSSDGKTAASVGVVSAAIRLWDLTTGNQLRVLKAPGKSISFLSFSPDNKTLASGVSGDDKVVRLWDVSSGKLLHKLEHPLVVATVSFSPDSKMLASGGHDKPMRPPFFTPDGNPSGVRLWDVATGKRIRTLEGHQQFISSLSFSLDGKVLVSGSCDRTIRLWDVTAGKEIRKLKCMSSFSCLSFAPDGKVLAGSNGPVVRLWDVATGEELQHPQEAHKAWVQSVSFSPDGRTLATGAGWGEEDNVRLWDTTSGKPLRKLEHLGGAHSVVFSPDGKILASGGAGAVCLWDATTGKQLRKLETLGGSPLAFSPDSKLLAAGSNSGSGPVMSNRTLRLWDVATGAQLHALEHPHLTMSVTFSPDGKKLAIGTGGSTIHLWDAVTGKELIGKFKEHWGEIVALSFSPDNKTLAAGSYDNKIHLLEVSTGKELRTLTGHANQVLAVAFSPSGRLLASGSIDQTVRLWEVNAGLVSECHRFRGHEAWVTAVAFSPDGRRLASGSHDSTALIWDVTGPTEGQDRMPRLTHGELTACWQSLASTDAARAYQAMRTLAAASDQSVPFLARRLLWKKSDPQQVARLLADLDSDDFRVRSKAAKELEKLGGTVEPALRQALKEKPSVEVRRRIQQLLEVIDPPNSEGVSLRLLRWLRAMEVLEWIDNPAARELLGKWATAPLREEVGREAKAALRRLCALSNP